MYDAEALRERWRLPPAHRRCTADYAAAHRVLLPAIDVTVSRLGAGITGTSTTVITADEIERSPGQTLQDILAREPGIQIRKPVRRR